MSIEEIRTLRNAKPFEPFDLVMNNGRAVRVNHPLRIAIAPRGDVVAVYETRAADILPVRQVREAKVHPLPPASRDQ